MFMRHKTLQILLTFLFLACSLTIVVAGEDSTATTDVNVENDNFNTIIEEIPIESLETTSIDVETIEDVEDLVEETQPLEQTATSTSTSTSTTITISETTESLSDTPTTSSTETASLQTICPLPPRQNSEATGKHRFNYASIDCAALVLKANPEATSVNAILSGNKDTYMLNKCNAPEKYLIIELCQEILIDTIVMASYEFFSSMVKDFEVYVSDRYPPREGWKLLGAFQARNIRTTQVWKVEQPAAWARYIRIDFKSHHGNEVYCPLTLLRIHGQTVFEDLKQDEQIPTEDKMDQPVEEDKVDLEYYASRPRVVPRYDDVSPVLWESGGTDDFFDQFSKRNRGHGETSAVPPEFAQLFKTYFGQTPGRQESFDVPPAIESGSPASSSTSTPSPTAQEGILRNMMKRLTVIERNTTSAYKYLEEQSVLFNDYFGTMFTRIGNLSYHMQLLNERLYSERVVARERAYRDRLREQQFNDKLSEMNERIEALSQKLSFYQTIQTVIMTFVALVLLSRLLGFRSPLTVFDSDDDAPSLRALSPVRDFFGTIRRPKPRNKSQPPLLDRRSSDIN